MELPNEFSITNFAVVALAAFLAVEASRLVHSTSFDTLMPFKLDNNPLSTEDALKILKRS